MIRLLQFTDTHLLADPAGQVRGVRTLASLEACLAHARRRRGSRRSSECISSRSNHRLRASTTRASYARGSRFSTSTSRMLHTVRTRP